MIHRSARLPLPDALRALAMLAVLLVNAAGYLVAPWGPLLGAPSPPDSALASTVQGLMAALIQGKGYPTLAFLFGMGLCLATRGADRQWAHQRGVRRQKRLLRLGLLHGAFIYFGDILTMYALVGWHLLTQMHEPWRSFRGRLRRAAWWALGFGVLSVVLTIPFDNDMVAVGQGWGAVEVEATLASTERWTDFWRLNAGAYVALQIGALLFFWPVMRLCMLCGVAAARLRLLTHRRWRHLLWTWVRRLAPPMLLLNVIYGAVVVGVVADGHQAFIVESIGGLVGPPLAAVYVMALAVTARAGQARWCVWLAPLGQRTLTLYVGHSVWCLSLFSGVGLGWRPGTLAMATLSLLLWCLAVALARLSGEHRWPLETWLARRRADYG